MIKRTRVIGCTVHGKPIFEPTHGHRILLAAPGSGRSESGVLPYREAVHAEPKSSVTQTTKTNAYFRQGERTASEFVERMLLVESARRWSPSKPDPLLSAADLLNGLAITSEDDGDDGEGGAA